LRVLAAFAPAARFTVFAARLAAALRLVFAMRRP
jgi:hypothetical protein